MANRSNFLPFVFEQDRKLLDLYQKETFYGFANGIPEKVWIIKYDSNAMHLKQMGDAFTTMKDPIPLDAIVDTEITDQNRIMWGVDETVLGMCWVLKDEDICNELTNLDRIRVDTDAGTDIYGVDAVKRYEGIGHEQWVYGITLVAVTQRNG